MIRSRTSASAFCRIYEFIPDSPPNSLATLEARYERLMERRSADGSETWLNWVLRLGTRYIGYVQATIVSGGDAAVAYVLSPDSWGYGLATEAVRSMIFTLRSTYGVRQVRAYVDERNVRSIGVLERLGFSRVGVTTFVATNGSESNEVEYIAR